MTSGTVIGREVERLAIDRWLAGPRPSALVLAGDAGIGKTILWEHAVQRAAAGGDVVWRWRAGQAERELAFAVLAALCDAPEVTQLHEMLAPPRRNALAVACGRAAGDRERAPGTDLIGLAVTDLLRALKRKVLLAIDDLQWVDEPSARALAFALRRLGDAPVGLIGTWRTGAGDGPGRLDLAFDRRERIEVGPLHVGALGRLLRDRLGAVHSRPLLVRIHEACNGNAFLALEMSRSLLSRGTTPASGEPFPVPAETGALVRDHLATLSLGARRCVVLVAMSPYPRLEVVQRILGAAAVEEAWGKGILYADGDRLLPQHPLFTSIAHTDASPIDRQTLRQALAEHTEDPVERAIHLCALPAPDIDALAEAGRLAMARGAPGVAASLFERGGLLVEAAEAAVAAGDPEKAEAYLGTRLKQTISGRTRAIALLALGEVVYVQRPNDALSLLLEALEHAEGDPAVEALAHSHVTSMADMEPTIGHRSAERAAQILESLQSPDPEHLACALLDRAFHRLLRGEQPSNADIDRALELRSGKGMSFAVRRAQEVAERCLFHLGRLGEARALDEAEYRRLTDAGQFGLLPPLAQSLSVLTQLTGDWAAARRYAHECLDLVEQGESTWRDRAALALGRIHAWEGDLDAARSVAIPALAAQEEAGDLWEAAIFCALLGFVELSVPDANAALRYLTRAAEHADAMAVVLPTQFRFLGDLVEAAVLANDLSLAEEVLKTRLEEPARRLPLPWTVAMARRGRGLLSAASARLGEALSALDEAVNVFDAGFVMPFERARTLYVRGQVHRRCGHRRDARRDLAEAASVFDGLGARVWAARAAQDLGKVAGRKPGSGLTPAERAVAELAAAGRSNKEIAAELVISARTVESQLSSVYRKLGLRSRAQLRDRLSRS